ncbi:MAG: cohesin domain-containing protein [Bacillota bacterium]|nr:cohesin domain-containing protein [Bacillota bacterium]
MDRFVKNRLFKTFFIALCITLFVSMQNTAAAEGLKLSAGESRTVAGEQFLVTISAENAAGSEGGQFILSYNPDLVRPVSHESGSLVNNAASSMDMVNLDYTPESLKYMWITPMADTADSGVVCRIWFEALKEGQASFNFYDIVIAPAGYSLGASVSGKAIIGSSTQAPTPTPTGEEEGEPVPEPENGEETADEDKEQIEENEDEADEDETPEPTDSDSFNYLPIIIVVALAILLPAGFAIFKRFRKPASKK